MRKVLLVVLVLGCREKSSGDSALGPQIEPPGLAPIKLGMTYDEARKLNPHIETHEMTGTPFIRVGGGRSLALNFGLDGKLTGATLHLPSSPRCIDEPEHAWGKATGQYRGPLGDAPTPMWTGTTWEAHVDFAATMCMVSFEARGEMEKTRQAMEQLDHLR